MTNEHDMENILIALLNEAGDVEPIAVVETFEDASIVTADRGIVVTMVNGTEFQISIVRSV